MRFVTVVASVAMCLVASGTALGKNRPKHLKTEATYKADATHIDLEDTQVDGETMGPAASRISLSHADKNYDFVKLRLGWHPEMVASTASLK